LFAGGTAAGFWCFSGAAFKNNRPKKTVRPPVRNTKSVRV
jgi:hypothetical protein